MKPKNYSLFFCLALTGCTGAGSHVLETVSAPAGAMTGYYLSGGNPAATAGGAAGAVALTKLADWKQARAQSRAYEEGYQQGRADAVKNLYWSLRYSHEPDRFSPSDSVTLYPVPIPEHELNGSIIQPTTQNLMILK